MVVDTGLTVSSIFIDDDAEAEEGSVFTTEVEAGRERLFIKVHQMSSSSTSDKLTSGGITVHIFPI